jgi:uncharacterized pyridoxal phosphate-containing UPF0001 family protein
MSQEENFETDLISKGMSQDIERDIAAGTIDQEIQ